MPCFRLESGPYPTIIVLHPWSNALDLLQIAPQLAENRFLVICPQGPDEFTVGPGLTVYRWFPSTLGQFDIQDMLTARQKLISFIEYAQSRYTIDPSKLVILGFGQGGVMSYCLALLEPSKFTALVALSSWLPTEILEHVQDIPALRNLSTLIQHGADNQFVLVEQARNAEQELRNLSVPITYQEFDTGRDITAHSLSAMIEWLQEKVLSS